MSPVDTLETAVVTSLSTFRVFLPHVVRRGVRRIATGDPLVFPNPQAPSWTVSVTRWNGVFRPIQVP